MEQEISRESLKFRTFTVSSCFKTRNNVNEIGRERRKVKRNKKKYETRKKK